MMVCGAQRRAGRRDNKGTKKWQTCPRQTKTGYFWNSSSPKTESDTARPKKEGIFGQAQTGRSVPKKKNNTNTNKKKKKKKNNNNNNNNNKAATTTTATTTT